MARIIDGNDVVAVASAVAGDVIRVRAVPVACNGVLYVMTENPCKLWAMSPGGK